LIEFNQNPDKNQYFKELKLLTIRILSVYKDQLFNVLDLTILTLIH
jgi:hypothetical protein